MRVYPYLLPIVITSVFMITANTQFIWLATLIFILVGILRNRIGKFEKDDIIKEYNFFHFNRKMNWLKFISGIFFVGFNIWSLYFLSVHELPLLHYVIFIYSYIVINSAFGISLAHDLMHSSHKIGRILSMFLLIQNGFFYLISDHIYTHHRYAATNIDPSTAQKGEGLYSYLYRSIIKRFKITFYSGSTFPPEKRTLLIRNNVLYFACCLGYLSICLILGKQTFICILLTYIFATLIYESVTYIQHYGLSRTKDEVNTPMELQHSWNCFYKTSAYMHYMMPIHSLHHLRKLPAQFEDFYGLSMPEPFGKMLVTSWFPNLWFKLMNK